MNFSRSLRVFAPFVTNEIVLSETFARPSRTRASAIFPLGNRIDPTKFLFWIPKSFVFFF